MSSSVGPFVLRRARQEEATAVHQFHSDHPSEFLWPRTPADFFTYAVEGSLYMATDPDDEIAGICYLRLCGGDDPGSAESWEFGGIYVRDDYRGCGLAGAMCRTALVAQLAATTPTAETQLIAHVHEFNDAPRDLLQRLGFAFNGKADVLPPDAPPNMKRNAQGQVVGHVFEFSFRACCDLASWLERFSGSVRGRDGSCTCSFGSQELRANPQTYIDSLVAIGSGYTAAR